MVNDNLVRRGLYTSVFPAGAKTITPTLSMKLGDMTMPIPFDTNVTPTRRLKKNYKGNPILIKDEGFNFVVRLTSNADYANLYMFVKVGSPLMFSYEIKGDVFTYPFLNQVTKVTVSDSGVSFTMFVSDNSNLEKNAYTCEVTIKNSSKDFSNGIEGNITVESGNWFDDEEFGKGQKSGLFSPMENKKVKNEMGLIINFTNEQGLIYASKGDLKSFLTSHLKMNRKVTYYYNENSFLDMESPDKYLLQEQAKWTKNGSKLGDFGDDKYVELVLSLDSATDATDNYTGESGIENKRLVTIILPNEFTSISPMTQEADGLEFSKGRITSKQFIDDKALFTFSDASECLIPNPEDKTFQAKDKNGQILKGKVVKMTLKEGNSSDALREQLAQRKKNNLNKTYSFEIEEEYTLDSVAWVTGKKNDFIKMIVPTQDSTGKEVFKVVNINIGEL
jgi:hypothetical protein